MTHHAAHLDDLGDGYGFRKVRVPLGVTAFGANAIVTPPGFEGFFHYHDTQDELYFVHQGTARFDVEDQSHELGPGSLIHVASTTHRRFSNIGDDDLVVLIVGGKDGYVERDGHLVDMDDLARRQGYGSGANSRG